MATDLTLDFDHEQHITMNNSETGISIDQDGEWDMSLFDDLGNLEYASELFQTLENSGFTNDALGMDFDIDLSPWSADTGSRYTDGEMNLDSLSPAHTLSSVLSPGSLSALSPCSTPDEPLSPQSQPSPGSVCSDSSGFSEAPPPARKPPKRTSQAAKVRSAQPARRPIQMSPRFSIQPRPVLTAVPLATAPLQTKTIIIQTLPAAVLPTLTKPAHINIQPAPPAGCPVVLSQPAQVLQIHTPNTITGHVVTMPTLTRDRPTPVISQTAVPVTLRCPSDDDDSKVSQKQQRMIKNRESASLSRVKKKEYLLTLEARLQLALTENQALKSENGTLKRQLEGLLTENTVLKAPASKKRAVCLMAVMVLLVLNVGPTSLFGPGLGSKLQAGSVHSGRHLLGFSPDTGAEPGPEDAVTDSSQDKALMVMKEPGFLQPPSPCLPPVNRTKCIELTHELRGWVHRHEVQQTKYRRMNKPARTILKRDEKEPSGAQIVTVEYTDTSEEKSHGSELQVYYAPHRTYSDLYDEINRRGDTFYVVSFRRDHLLLPATSHNKGRRPKMSMVLPAMNINDSIIKDKEFEVMMQIDCEVTDTRILHIKSSSIPAFLRVNRTDTLYPPSPADSQATPPVAVLMGSV
ncbi:cyclic AMP-dependent transcription factor ATF-6 alpha [Osmerus mordax]|uniref:cyclic AMP-dependent transcription factor ATF-6 alpha n=1 Tax=Osmerus mordax TaxID=8014 RepID=UPI00350F656E